MQLRTKTTHLSQKISKYALDEYFYAHFCPHRKSANFCHPGSLAPVLLLIDVTLACEDANSKLVDVVTLADFDDEEHVGNSRDFDAEDCSRSVFH